MRISMETPTIRQPSAFLPVAMSRAALSTLILHISLFGVARESDEGSAAHIWQLLMAGQVPVVGFFAVKWLAKTPRQAVKVLVMQIGAAAAALAPVYWLGL